MKNSASDRSVRWLAGALAALVVSGCGGGGGGGPTSTTAYFEGTVSGVSGTNAAGLEGGSIVLKGNDGQAYSVSSVSGPLALSVTGSGGSATLAVERHPVNQICTVSASATTLGSRGAAALSCVYTPINDTGLSQCMFGVDCGLQDAGTGRGALGSRLAKANPNSPGAFDYTRICNSGQLEGSGGCVLAANAQPGSELNEWGCTRDNVTGLVWLAEDFGGRYEQSEVDALMTGYSRCGRSGWRIPSVDQLQTLIYSAGEKVGDYTVAAQLAWLPMLNYGRRNQAETPAAAGASPRGSGFWTSTKRVSPSVGAEEAWYVEFWGNGRVKIGESWLDLRVLPVSTADLGARFADSYHRQARWVADMKAGTLLDRRSGLMWAMCSVGRSFNAVTGRCDGEKADGRTFRDALTESVVFNQDGTRNRGYGDWRLPNRAELSSLVDCIRWRPLEAGDPGEVMSAGCTEPDLKKMVDLDLPAAFPVPSYWTSSWVPSTVTPAGVAYQVDFSTGSVGLADLDGLYGVRFVRSAR